MPFRPMRVILYAVLWGISVATIAWTSSALIWYLRKTDSQGRPILESKPSSDNGAEWNGGAVTGELPPNNNFVLENDALPWKPMLGSHRGDYHALIGCLTWWIAMATLQVSLISFSGVQELLRTRHPPRHFAKLFLFTCLLSLLCTIFFKVALPIGLTRMQPVTSLALLARDGVLVAFTFAWISTNPSRDNTCVFSDDHVGGSAGQKASNTMSRSLARDGAVPVQAFRPHPSRRGGAATTPVMVSPPVKAQQVVMVRPVPLVTVPVPPSCSSGSSTSPKCEAVSLMEPDT